MKCQEKMADYLSLRVMSVSEKMIDGGEVRSDEVGVRFDGVAIIL